ncbi:MAG: tyrosine-type recombinase/integrase [Nitrospinales bacterium]
MTIWKTKYGWRAEFVFKGERVIAKGTFKYKDDARQWEKDEKERLKNLKNPSLRDRDTSFYTLSQKYLSDCKVNFSKKTFDEKKYCLERFYKFCKDIDVADIDPPMVLDFINKRAKSKSNNAANKDRKNLKAFYTWVQEMYSIMHDPIAPIKKKAHEKNPRRIISITDILKVILASKGHDRVLMSTYWNTGGRKTEVLRLTWSDDINFEERWIRLGTRKSKSREMTYEKLWMNDDLYKLLMWQWKNRHPRSPYVFCHMNPKSKYYGKRYYERRKTLNTLCDTAEVERFGYHDIRHTVAKYLNDLQKVDPRWRRDRRCKGGKAYLLSLLVFLI